MKRLTVINVMLSRGLGGIEQVFVDYLAAFDKLGHKSIGIVSKLSQIRSAIPRNIKVKSVFNFGEWDVLSAMMIKRIVSKYKPDLIITHGRRATKLVKYYAAACPVVGVAHNYSLEHLLNLDGIFAITKDLESCLVERGYDRKKIHHIPNMIDTSAERTFSSSSSVKLKGVPVIGAMGRFVKKKGFDLFIKALSILKDEGVNFRAVIAGDGEEAESLKALAKDLGVEKSVNFLGWARNKAKFFSAIDIFCLPSTEEPFGIVLLEAMLHKRPTVSFLSQGPSEIGTDRQNILFAENGNERDLADKLKLLMRETVLFKKIAKSGLELVEKKYSSKIVGDLIDQSVRQIVSTDCKKAAHVN